MLRYLIIITALVALLIGFFIFNEQRRRQSKAVGLKKFGKEKIKADLQKKNKKNLILKIRELEEENSNNKLKKKQGISFDRKLRTCFPNYEPKIIYTACASISFIALLIQALMNVLMLWSVAASFIGPILILKIIVNMKYEKNLLAFDANFPDAIDLIVRGLKAGLPSSKCYQIASEESLSPVKEEFELLNIDMRCGLSLEEAIDKLKRRMPLKSVNFFSAAVIMQSRTGGNLSDILQNLSDVLRAKRIMRQKIKSLTSEVKMSSRIMIAAPFLVIIGMSLSDPEYLPTFIHNKTASNIGVGMIIWLMVGVGIIKNMTSFIDKEK